MEIIIRNKFRLRFFICLVSIVIFLISSGCATINLSPSLGDLEEVTIEGSGSEKILLVDFEGIINNQKDKDFTGRTTELGMVEKIRGN